MQDIELKRVSTGEDGTFGVLLYEGKPFAVTLEPEWLDNKRSISCIPAGMYYAQRVNSPKFGDTFEVTNVIDRSHILFHAGNVEKHTHGCILVGEEFGVLGNKTAVLSSRRGLAELFRKVGSASVFRLYVRGS